MNGKILKYLEDYSLKTSVDLFAESTVGNTSKDYLESGGKKIPISEGINMNEKQFNLLLQKINEITGCSKEEAKRVYYKVLEYTLLD